MKKILLSMIAAIIVLFLSFPQVSVSEIKEGSVEITPFAGYYFLDHQKDKIGYGLRGGYNFSRTCAIEGAFDYAGSRAQFYRVDFVHHLITENAFNPFVFAGIGVDHTKRSSDFHTRMLGEVGAGVKYFLTENIAIRGDVRDIQDRYNHVAATLGIVFTFGGKKPATVQAVTPEPKVEEKVVILASEPKVEEKVIVAAAEPKIIILAFEDIHFDFDKSTLKPEAQTILKRNIQLLKEHPKAQIRIAGYTSASGTKDYNQKLSERRANAVEAYLVNEGLIAPDRLAVIGYGKTRPAEYEAAPKELYSKAAKANMRVLFEIIVK